MSDTHADRNLLVGNLALQMDFIDRDQLVSAMQAWMSKKSTSLVDILLEQSAIDEDTKDLLVALEKKHLSLHAGDPAQSLATASVAPALQRELADLGDGDIDRTLAFVSKAKPIGEPAGVPTGERAGEPTGESAADPHSTLMYLPTNAPEGIRFRVLRLHDKGGLGTVSVAVDDELHREVALKEIQPQFANDDLARERFTLEAEVTGGLEHPGIVPVYGFGYYADGRPFYAMRFIRGHNLDYAISKYHDSDQVDVDPSARAVEFRRLVGHIVDVCHAIQYAHCRGVLHRDLKPGNIMLGKYGETLVVDWGLARTTLQPESTPLTSEAPLKPIYSSGTDHTTQGTQLGTPAFMPPEQAEGRLDRVDARSDVYSLGATLYVLLAGQRAFRDESVGTVLTKVLCGDFPRPRKVNPNTPPALEAVCLKAMSFEPQDRYDSAAALAQDLEHWLADEPVTAWKEPASLRLRRWVKRHRTLVASSAAALVAALLILSVTVGLLNVAKNREARERQRAERNLSLAKQAVDTMLTEVASEELENVPQMEATRRKLLGKARDFYGKFCEQTPEDAALRLETALANKRLGDIFRLMGEVDDSEQAYTTAIEQLEALAKEFPDQPVYQQQLANANNFLGVLYKKFDRRKARATYNLTVGLQSDLVEKHPDHPVYRQELARSYYNRGILQTVDATTGDEAEADFRQAMHHLQWILEGRRAEADLPGCRQELARCYSNLAILHRSRGELASARENYEQAIGVAEPLVEDFPNQRKYQKELALYYNNLSNLLVAQGDDSSMETARTANERSLSIYATVAAAIPEIRSDLGNIHHSRGVILAKLGEQELAQAEFGDARALFEPLVAEFPEFPQYTDRLGNALYELAKLSYAAATDRMAAQQIELGRDSFEDALDLVGQAAELHQRILDRYAQDATCRAHLSSDYFLKAWTLKKLGAARSPALTHATSTETAEALAVLSPENAIHLKLTGELYALAAELASKDPLLEAPRQQLLQRKYAARAIELLRAAIEKGYNDVAGLKEELNEASEPGNLFQPLLQQEEFSALMRLLQQ